jgi:hypothetical protein
MHRRLEERRYPAGGRRHASATWSEATFTRGIITGHTTHLEAVRACPCCVSL